MGVENNENERYARADVQGGYLYNKSEIDYFKQTQAIDVMHNLMLGDFNKKGTYVINKGIIEQLVKVKKVYQYSFGSTTFCQSVQDIGGYGKIDFAIKMRNNTQNKTITATLQLLETIDRANGYYQNTNTVSIEVYTAPESNTFVVDMLKYFNVVSKKEDGFLRKDRDEENVDLIIARKKYEELLNNNLLGKLDDLNKVLFEKRIKLLSRSEVGKKILAKFNTETYKINGWFLKEGMPGYYRYLNQVLDGLLEVHSAEVLQDVALTAGLRKASEAFALDASKSSEMTGKMLFSNTDEKLNAQNAKEYAEAQQNKQSEEVKQPARQPETKQESYDKESTLKQTAANTVEEQQQVQQQVKTAENVSDKASTINKLKEAQHITIKFKTTKDQNKEQEETMVR